MLTDSLHVVLKIITVVRVSALPVTAIVAAYPSYNRNETFKGCSGIVEAE